MNKIKIKNKKTNYIILIIALFSLLFLSNYAFALTCKCKTCSGFSGCNHENFYDDECPCSNECASPTDCNGDDDDDDDDDDEIDCYFNACTWDDKCRMNLHYTDETCWRVDQCYGSDSDCGDEVVGGCGDGTCDSPSENCDNCPQDCPCPAGQNCVNGVCVDPCAGVSCGSCQYCSGGNCYYYCSGTSSSCGCTSCTNCGSCAYCSNYNCYSYCAGTDTSCGCTSCTNCNTLDNWYNKGSTYPCCDLTNPDNICTCQDQEYRNYYCSGTSCTYSVTDTQIVRSGCNNCGYCKTCSAGSCIDKPGVKGTVTNVSLEKIKGAEIKILGLDKSYTTDANGYYFICEFPQGTYDIVASKKGFDPVNKQFDFDGTGIVNIGFVLYTAGSDCKPDCSKTTDPEMPVCHMDCEGINGCNFYDTTLMNICTREGREGWGIPVGNTVSYNETYKARCCEGIPYLHEKIPGTSLVFPETDTLVRITRIVFFRGQFARMIIDVWE